ncbi:hypothetical protein DFH09DRAFT_283178 [Mycena vulgaris]|nr:hypothetical protein DFH09DRAFT_283178 [Mycena vulgaris]
MLHPFTRSLHPFSCASCAPRFIDIRAPRRSSSSFMCTGSFSTTAPRRRPRHLRSISRRYILPCEGRSHRDRCVHLAALLYSNRTPLPREAGVFSAADHSPTRCHRHPRAPRLPGVVPNRAPPSRARGRSRPPSPVDDSAASSTPADARLCAPDLDWTHSVPAPCPFPIRTRRPSLTARSLSGIWS